MTDRRIDPVELTAALIRCPSVTPEEGGALVLLERLLTPLGFRCRRVDVGGICNLYARWGAEQPNFCFAGHTDVVPAGAAGFWTHDPFGGEIHDGMIWGRGAADMKSGVAAFAAAVAEFLASRQPRGAITLLITGDEEGDAQCGTRAVLDWMAEQGETIDHCLVGEPTSPETLGEMIKIGRRGSMTGHLTATGVQGHAAYPQRARNPLPVLVRLLDRLATRRLDQGTAHFEPSTLALTTIDVGNPANNVIPAQAQAMFNIRFNDAHSAVSLTDWTRRQIAAATEGTGIEIALDMHVSGEAFITPPGRLSDLVSEAVFARTGVRPELSTSGGTSDARFIKDVCPVVEFGLVGRTMHKTDERVAVADVRNLALIYRDVLEAYFPVG